MLSSFIFWVLKVGEVYFCIPNFADTNGWYRTKTNIQQGWAGEKGKLRMRELKKQGVEKEERDWIDYGRTPIQMLKQLNELE